MTALGALRRKTPALLLDIATVIAVALLLAALFGSANLWPGRLALVFPPLEGAVFDVGRLSYYPWTDLAENVFSAFLVAHGARVYEYGALAHTPGVPELVGAAMRLAGFSRATPSPQSATAAYLTAAFVTLAFQSACVYGPLRALSFGPSAAAAATLAVVASTAFTYHFALPMSETLLAYLLIFVPVLSWRMIGASDGAGRLAAAVWLGGPVTLGCVALGLTVAPANIVIALACLGVLLVHLQRHPRATIDTLRHDRRCRAAFVAAVAIVLVTLMLCKPGTLWFWSLGINADQELYTSPTLRESFERHVAGFFSFDDPVGSRYPHLAIVLAGFAAAVLIAAQRENRRAHTARSITLFVALIAIAAVLTQWRMNHGYKSAPMFGLTIGVLLLLLAFLPSRLRRAPNLFLLPLFGAALLQWQFVPAALSYSTQAPPRIPALDEARVCRLGATRDCRCMQVTVFGPQIFFFHDMNPCRDRAPTFNLLFGRNAVTRAWLMSDIRDPAHAFWLHDDATMIENGIPREAIRTWRSEMRCVAIDNQQSICFSPGPRP